jgi:chloride channel protein, CIC family
MGFEDVIRFMAGSNQQDFPVVDESGNLTGIISMTDLREAMADAPRHKSLRAGQIAQTRVAAVTMEDSLNTALKLMAEADLRELPVVSREDPRKVISLISRKDITRTYHEEMERARGPGRAGRP